LYKAAYFGTPITWTSTDSFYGKYSHSLVLEIKDKHPFMYNKDTNDLRFCYSQILPKGKATAGKMMQVMQRDLQNYFEYDVSIETRKIPCLRLTATPEARKMLATKGGVKNMEFAFSGIDYRNVNVKTLIGCVSYYGNLDTKDLSIIDETGITGNIDIKFDAAVTDFEEVKAALQKQGLDIVPGEKEMKVLVLRDPK
jgi:hypothetical protein